LETKTRAISPPKKRFSEAKESSRRIGLLAEATGLVEKGKETTKGAFKPLIAQARPAKPN
jgi:hypothetical protein